ncbi:MULTISPECIES: ferritin-like domain-containing protein [Pusillimonas]|uniref:ferritin-like domain-containing protein n=1 Tax=Pusillimonas TaxID=305976 RepID=UPI000E59FD86|nr:MULTISPECIES: ferritin-like domain-containing protein [Pusillimonas]MDX3893238.1 ferritin-like domain-containing protein [Pusillimonas sp.]TFL09992.1 ferritin-like domain-containing protein [Pusillimonas caeni]
MTTRAEENLLDWLRDAHAMEEQAEKMLTKTAERLENYPELKARIQQHIEETRRQAQMVRGCIERLGGDTSAVKDATAKMMAMAQGMSGMFVSDEVVKASLASYAFEHMEIASYRALIAAAELCGDVETQRVCEQILPEEEAMANWLAERLPGTVQKFLARDETPDTTAKH